MKKKLVLITITILILVVLFVVNNKYKIIEYYRISTYDMMPQYKNGEMTWFSSLKNPTYNNIVVCSIADINGKQKNKFLLFRLIGLPGDTIEMNDGYTLRNNLMADDPKKLMFRYFAKRKAIFDMKYLNNSEIPIIISNDSVLFNLSSAEYKRFGQYALLHKISPAPIQKPQVSMTPNFRNADNFGPLIVPKGYCFILGDNRGNNNDSRFMGIISMKNIVGTVIGER